jgi:Zn-dependent protease with chaperone function
MHGLNKPIYPIIITALIIYSLSYFNLFLYPILLLLVVFYTVSNLIVPNGVKDGDSIVFHNTKSIGSYSAGLIKRYVVISRKTVDSEYYKAVLSHEYGHSIYRHTLIKLIAMSLYCFIFMVEIKNGVELPIFLISIIGILLINYTLFVALEISADKFSIKLGNKFFLKKFINVCCPKTLCNKIRLKYIGVL